LGIEYPVDDTIRVGSLQIPKVTLLIPDHYRREINIMRGPHFKKISKNGQSGVLFIKGDTVRSLLDRIDELGLSPWDRKEMQLVRYPEDVNTPLSETRQLRMYGLTLVLTRQKAITFYQANKKGLKENAEKAGQTYQDGLDKMKKEWELKQAEEKKVQNACEEARRQKVDEHKQLIQDNRTAADEVGRQGSVA